MFLITRQNMMMRKNILTSMKTAVLRIFFVAVLLTTVLQNLVGLTDAVVWRSAQGVSDFSSYVSVTPVRFSIPSDIGEAVWQFRATKSSDSCDTKNVSIYLQFGSLPLANPNGEEFPDKFYLGRSRLAQLDVTSNNISVSYSELFPRAGDWYAIAFIAELNDRIQQKGLFMSCEYKFTASLERKALPPFLHVHINKASLVELTDSSTGDGVWIGFAVPTTAVTVQLDISDCNGTSCDLQLRFLDNGEGKAQVTNCSNVDNVTCSITLTSPLVGMMQYVYLEMLTPGNASMEIYYTAEECSEDMEVADNSTLSCVLERALDRFQDPEDFTTTFIRLENDTVQKNQFLLSNSSVSVVPFLVERITDIGGSLLVAVSFKRKDVAENQQVRVCGQLMVNRFPTITSDLDLCANTTNSLQVNCSSLGEDGNFVGSLYVPYPEEGQWLLALGLQCYNTTNDSSVVVDCADGRQNLTVGVSIGSCVDGGCNGQGECKEYIKGSDFIVFSTCQCAAGWRGYGCTDGREAFSDSSQLLDVLLLTLSNLFFVPAIVVALYRGYYIEALVYFYNMFFSTFYHACDGDRIDKYLYCMTEYKVLSIGDFLASTCSLWVTLVAMAQIPLVYGSAVQMAGPLALLVGVLLDKHSLWVIAVPTAAGLLLTIVSWVTRCCRSKACFPEKRRYLWMVPGVLFAVAGAIVYAFFETAKNYKYLHSAWHVCLSLSIIFLLPPRRKAKVTTSLNFDDTESTEGLVLGPNNYTRRMNFEL